MAATPGSPLCLISAAVSCVDCSCCSVGTDCSLPRNNLCGFASFSQIPESFYFASNLNHERDSLRCELSLEMGLYIRCSNLFKASSLLNYMLAYVFQFFKD